MSKESPIYHEPPERIFNFLRWFCDDVYLEEIEGDLYELFQEEVDQYGLKAARRRFLIKSLPYIRPYFFGKKDLSLNLQYHLTMIRHYFKISFRHLWKQRLYSSINILGLAIGLACCIVVLFYVKEELGYDTYHKNYENLYRISINATTMSSGSTDGSATSPLLWGPALKRDYPEVEDFARFVRLVRANNPWRLSVEDKTFEETDILYADPNTFDLFNWPVLKGNPNTALSNLNSIVITQEMATKYFGDANPIGKTIKLDPRLRNREGSFETTTYDYQVTAVLEDIPSRSHFTFDFLLPTQHLNNIFGLDINGSGEESRWFWRGTIGYTYIQLTDGTDPKTLESKFAEFQDRYVGEDTRSRGYFYTPFLQRIDRIYLDGNLNSQLQPVGDKTYVYGFSLVALFILIIACINFMNLSTARAATRAKEVGLRKVIGAMRRQLLGQFLGESLVITFIALLLGITFSRYLLPIFYAYLEKDFFINYANELLFLVALIGIGAIVGVLAGSYPALFLSRFTPIKALKGNFIKTNAGFHTRQGLVIFQFLISVFLIIFTLTLHKQLNFMKSSELGFEQERVIVIPPMTARGFSAQAETIKAELSKFPEIESVTMSSGVPGQGFRGDAYAIKDANAETGFTLREYFTDYKYVDFYGLELIAGRNFSESIGSDEPRFEEGQSGEVTAILNETAVRKFGWNSPEEAIGKQIVRDPNAKDWFATIIGVVKDFHTESLVEEITPTALILRSNFLYLSAKIKEGNIQSGIAQLEKVAKQFAPDSPFEYNFLDESFRAQYETEQRLGEVFSGISLLAILIACLGLFGLAAFTTSQRLKEISIRKTLGASTSNLVFMLSQGFIRLVFIAALIAIPLAWYFVQKGLENFAYRIDNTFDIFILSLLIAVLIAFLTVSFHTFRAARMNPADVLKGE